MLPQHYPPEGLSSAPMSDATWCMTTPPQRHDNGQAYGLFVTSATITVLGISLLALGAMLVTVLGIWAVGVPLICAGVGLLR